MRPTRPAPGRDAALLLARLVLGTIVVAHGYGELDGIGHGAGRTSLPVATVSASVVAAVAVVGGLLLVAGLRTGVAAACAGVAMVGAAATVPQAAGRGWELAGAVGAALAALVVAGPGRWSVAHVRTRRARPAPGLPPVAPLPPRGRAAVDESIPPAGLPLIPLVRLSPVPERGRTSRPAE